MKAWSNEHLSLLTLPQLLKARDYAAGNAASTGDKGKRRFWKWERTMARIDEEIAARKEGRRTL